MIAPLDAVVISKHQAAHLYDLVLDFSILYNLTVYHCWSL